MTASTSRLHGEPARREFIALRNELLGQLAREQNTKRQVIDALRRKHEKLRAVYLRIAGTTYQGWLDYGTQPYWDEVVAAARDDAVWDRLVERCTRGQTAR